FRVERRDPSGREVRHAHHETTRQVGLLIPPADRSGRPTRAVRAEVDRQLVARVARLGEVLDGEDAPDAHLDLLEVFDRRHVRIIGPVSDVFHRATDWEIVTPTRVLRVTWDDGNV